jgi:hypothetical protein
VVRIPSFARRPDTVDDDQPMADTRTAEVRREQVDDRARRPADTAPGVATGTATVAPADVDTRRERAQRATAERAAAERAADRAEAERMAEPTADRTADATPVGPRPRASLLATLGLVVGVASAMLVLTGLLAGYGIALGIVGLLLSIGGLSATGKRHVAGKSDALLGIVLNIGAMVIGALALTGALAWLTTETDKVEQLRQWLDTQFANRL